MVKKPTLLLGAHMSIAGSLSEAITRGESIGCTAIQIFTKSNRQWATKDISQEELDAFKEIQKKSSVACVIAHASYLINLGSPDHALHKKSVAAACKELETCEKAGIPFLVLHPGSSTTSTKEEGCQAVARGLNQILTVVSGATMILLETMAGQGTVLGSTFKELATIRNLVNDKHRIGFCLDTCHVFSAGYDISTSTGYEQLWSDFEKEIGIAHLKALHLNDSKKECGSLVDRHENIGQGLIGEKGFSLLMNDSRFFKLPKILETPKASLDEDLQNLTILKKLLTESTKKEFLV